MIECITKSMKRWCKRN